MRLTRLLLGRYGHLSDVELAFPAEPGLHIVLGANEAGKSTALSAIGDCLFGFPHRTPFAFLHATRDLRIGVTLQAADGRIGTFIRRKGRKEDLSDAADTALPQSAIAAFMAGASRERFDHLFGLNGAELRRGGDAILKGEGEVGEAIVQAHTGMHGFRALVDRLDGEAGRLFGDKRGRREFHDAMDRYKAAKDSLAQATVEPKDYKQARDDLDRLEQARTDNTLRARTLHAERSKLDRVRRTTPARLALARAADARSALGPVADLPGDAAERFQRAVTKRDQALHDLAREQARAAELDAEHRALPAQPPILAEAGAIDALAAHRQHVSIAERDRETLRLQADQHAARIRDDGRRLGLTLDPDALTIPNALDRERVTGLLSRHQRLLGQGAKAADDVAAATAGLADAEAALAALPPAEPWADLRGVIESVRAEGRLDADRLEAEGALRAAVAELAQGLAALPLWDRGADALQAAAVPLDADIQRLADRLKIRWDEADRLCARVAEHDRALLDLAAEAKADAFGGEPPTAEAIQAARAERDHAWASLCLSVTGGALPVEAEMAAYEALVHAADALADRRAAEGERVVAAERRRAEDIRRRMLRDADDALHRLATEALDACRQQWRDLWRPAGLDPAEPASMREWMQKRAAILAQRQRVTAGEQRLAALALRYDAAVASLNVLVPVAAGETLPSLLRRADKICKDREAADARLAQARSAVEAARAGGRKAEREAARCATDRASWTADWCAVAALLGLAPDAPAELGATALNVWNDIDTAARARRDALGRIAEMTATIDRFGHDAAAVAARVAPDLAGHQPHEAVAALSARLSEARQGARRRKELDDDLLRLRDAVRGLEDDRDAAEHTLAGLRALAGAIDDAALRQAIALAADHHVLSAQIADRLGELGRLDDGKTLAELEAESRDADFDALPARIGEIEAELRAMTAEDLAHQTRMTELKQALAAMEAGRDAAAASQDMETALADIHDIAERYTTARMAHVLLRAGIDRFRRQQQDPLLSRAGQIFARLTEGRYDRLGVDEDDGKMLIKACRPDGSECQADRLSEGTLDQLYLALRLAAIESYARTTEPLPFIADDLLVNFDDRRARAAIRVLADFGRVTQVILFTHHGHIAGMAEPGLASVHRLSSGSPALV